MRVQVPGDKSLTQRALLFATLAEGRSRVRGLLHGGDAASTAEALRSLGAGIPALPGDGSEIAVQGVGLRGLKAPHGVLDLGNSGTGTRLLIGALAGSGVSATLTGDDSLRSRPMVRVTEPLTCMGARFESLGPDGRLPLVLHGRSPLLPLEWRSPVASAQVKSAILLAGLVGGAAVAVTEPRRSRDHTERMLGLVGVPVSARGLEGGWRVAMPSPPERIDPLDFDVPGDFSSAAFLLALAALGGAGLGLAVTGVGLNPTRTAFLDVLTRMGATPRIDGVSSQDSEPVGDVWVGPGALRATSVGEAEVPGLIDELPLVAVLGARAEGVTRITGAAELRAKESDRIEATVENLRALGARAEELPDGLEVEGSERPLQGRVTTHGDHRIAMAFGVLGAVAGNNIEIDDPAAADVSFPGFWRLLEAVRLRPGSDAG